MSTIKTDQDYQEAIKGLLTHIKERHDSPGSLLSPDNQHRFIQTVLYQATLITESEPHLRGAVVSSLTDLKQLDLDNLSKDYGRLLAVAQSLYEILSQIPAARLGRSLQVQRKAALERANTIL